MNNKNFQFHKFQSPFLENIRAQSAGIATVFLHVVDQDNLAERWDWSCKENNLWYWRMQIRTQRDTIVQAAIHTDEYRESQNVLYVCSHKPTSAMKTHK